MTQHWRTSLAVSAFLFALALPQSPAGGQQMPALAPGPDGVIFAIGVENKLRDGFRTSNWKGIETYECTIGIDCAAKDFPMRLHSAETAQTWDRSAVARAIIDFNLSTDIANVVFRVARFGGEKSVVRVDDGSETVITQDMMDVVSEEDGWGRFDLPLGTLGAGPHQIILSVLDEEGVSGRHSLDAIILKTVD